MNDRFGRDGSYRDVHEPFWRGSEGDRLRDPERDGESNASGYRPGPTPPEYSNARYNQYGRNAAQSEGGGFAGRGPKGYARHDERIREDVCERLSWNDEVDATDISVRVENGEVTLEGSVETRHMKRLAEDLADQALGVTDVHNTLRVKKAILTELKEKLSGEAEQHHYARTGTKPS